MTSRFIALLILVLCTSCVSWRSSQLDEAIESHELVYEDEQTAQLNLSRCQTALAVAVQEQRRWTAQRVKLEGYLFQIGLTPESRNDTALVTSLRSDPAAAKILHWFDEYEIALANEAEAISKIEPLQDEVVKARAELSSAQLHHRTAELDVRRSRRNLNQAHRGLFGPRIGHRYMR